MEIKLLDTNKPTQLAVLGRVDTVTADDFFKAIDAILQEYPQDMEWDCSEWKFLSSAGLRVLFMLVKKTKMLKTSITLKHLDKNVYEVLKISGFTTFLNIEP
ncbi:MAG: STAS domain-containing protein [Phascolarctobacterium sp.]